MYYIISYHNSIHTQYPADYRASHRVACRGCLDPGFPYIYLQTLQVGTNDRSARELQNGRSNETHANFFDRDMNMQTLYGDCITQIHVYTGFF